MPTDNLPTRLLRAANWAPLPVMFFASVLLALPAASLATRMMLGRLGVNPAEILLRQPGSWSLELLLLVLSVGPLRQALVMLSCWHRAPFGKRLSDWNWLVRLRRPIGLAAFFYALLHVSVYALLDLDGDWQEWLNDLRDKRHIAAGTASLLLLVPLALTSTAAAVRLLKRYWKRLHLLVYPAALLALLHFVLLSKPGVVAPLVHAVLLAGLLCCSGWQRLFRSHPLMQADGSVPERSGTPPAASS
ncbi:ferric reductase-like transmembrane domain-containing protein [Actimicrobium sp. CCC2.4]|uniref:ferric reductase-like transmembrane domain-containing protein n=1 Tax=Actimicrobium sp. CCC2.4 TaxID=3048606 RepID=UPI002AC96D11|nr:ferric reductase-like transmembrane domain-containing protein [Actimicrobium sp. CCC2.4]WPX33437.1 ferric reductase-like transmembrane domain-containing protein [Actimicrobium sp. CCC2.4]